MPAAHEKPTGLVTTAVQPALDPSLLPDRSDSSISLEPTNLPEWEQTCRLNAAEWGGPLPEPSYIDRELYLAESEIARNGGVTGWILTSTSLPVTEDGSRPILAACETTRKTAYVAKDGNMEKIIAHGIGSVYCRSEYRGKGYAALMIKELGRKLETFQQLKGAKGRFSVLWSDIGKHFYAKHGWKAFPSTHVNLKPIDNAGEYHQRKAEITPLPQLEDLTTQDLHDLPLVQNLEAQLVQMSSADPTKTFVALSPNLAQFEWHFMREEFLAEFLGRQKPEVKGAIDRRTGVALIWSRTYAQDPATWILSVQYAHVPLHMVGTQQAQRSLSALLLRAQYEAKLWEMHSGVEVWDPQEDIIQAVRAISRGQEFQVISRDQEHVCSLKWNGPDADEVVWLANERFAWC